MVAVVKEDGPYLPTLATLAATPASVVVMSSTTNMPEKWVKCGSSPLEPLLSAICALLSPPHVPKTILTVSPTDNWSSELWEIWLQCYHFLLGHCSIAGQCEHNSCGPTMRSGKGLPATSYLSTVPGGTLLFDEFLWA